MFHVKHLFAICGSSDGRQEHRARQHQPPDGAATPRIGRTRIGRTRIRRTRIGTPRISHAAYRARQHLAGHASKHSNARQQTQQRTPANTATHATSYTMRPYPPTSSQETCRTA